MPDEGGADITLPDLIATPDQPQQPSPNRLLTGGAGRGWLTFDQVRSHAEAAGFSGEALNRITAIAYAESRGNPNAFNRNDPAGGSFGITQINGVHPGARSALGDPRAAMDLAYKVSKAGTDFSPWSTYTSGAYRQYLDQAGAASSLSLGGAPSGRLASIENPLGLPSGGQPAAESDQAWLDKIPPAETPAASPWLRLMQLSAIAQSAHIQPVLTKYDPRKGMVAQPEPMQPTRIMQTGTGELPSSAQIQRTALADSALPTGSVAASRQPLSRSPNTMLQPTQYVTRLGMRPYYNES